MPSEPNSSSPDRQSVRRVLEAGADRLAAAGVASPRADARRLWAALAGTTPGDVWLTDGRVAPSHLVKGFESVVARRARGAPEAAACGTQGFRTLALEVTDRTLIPRPETEGLVDAALTWCRSASAGAESEEGSWGDALDLGTGSGCIALSLAVEGRFQRVVATDASASAAQVARRNRDRIAPVVPVEIRCGSFFEPVAEERFRVVVANPPYLSEAEYACADESVRRFEPREALVSAEGGLRHLRVILQRAGHYLEPGGLLALEVDCSRAEKTAALAWDAGWTAVEIRLDQFRRQRYLLATREQVQ